MDSLDFRHIKMEKANAKLKYRRMQKITAMFRLLELCIFLIVFSRFTSQLPVAFKLSGEYFRGLSVTALSPRFVFILGNAIVIVLFLKSGHLSPKDADRTSSSNKLDLYDEYVRNCEKNRSIYKDESSKKQSKQINVCISGETLNSNAYKSCHNVCVCISRETVKSDAYKSCHTDNKERNITIQRSQSENLKRVPQEEEAGGELRRTVPVRCRGSVDNEEEKPAVVRSYKEDGMSSEEFRRTVEAFIARQQRFLREEEEFSATS